jgi:hypothetical protein
MTPMMPKRLNASPISTIVMRAPTLDANPKLNMLSTKPSSVITIPAKTIRVDLLYPSLCSQGLHFRKSAADAASSASPTIINSQFRLAAKLPAMQINATKNKMIA